MKTEPRRVTPRPQPDSADPVVRYQYVPAPPPAKSPWADPKVVAAVVALVTALAGGVELRVQVGLLSAKIDRIEAEQREVRRELQAVRMVARGPDQ